MKSIIHRPCCKYSIHHSKMYHTQTPIQFKCQSTVWNNSCQFDNIILNPCACSCRLEDLSRQYPVIQIKPTGHISSRWLSTQAPQGHTMSLLLKVFIHTLIYNPGARVTYPVAIPHFSPLCFKGWCCLTKWSSLVSFHMKHAAS